MLDGAGRDRFNATMEKTGGMDMVSAQLCRRIRFEENEYTIA
jgi:hypothetical protein